MTIRVELFDFPTKEEMLPLFKKSPLYGYRLKKEIFYQQELSLFEKIDYEFQINEFVNYLNNRVSQLNLNYAYVMYYFNRGISDEKGYSLKHLTEKEWTNEIHFEHHTDSLFQRAFTVLDLVAHILFSYFDLERKEKKDKKIRDIKISFNNLMYQLKSSESNLYRNLNEIRNSSRFQRASKVRNDIIHNQPPYRMQTRYTKHPDVVISVGVFYISSKELMEIMHGLLKCLKQIFKIIESHIRNKKSFEGE